MASPRVLNIIRYTNTFFSVVKRFHRRIIPVRLRRTFATHVADHRCRRQQLLILRCRNRPPRSVQQFRYVKKPFAMLKWRGHAVERHQPSTALLEEAIPGFLFVGNRCFQRKGRRPLVDGAREIGEFLYQLLPQLTRRWWIAKRQPICQCYQPGSQRIDEVPPGRFRHVPPRLNIQRHNFVKGHSAECNGRKSISIDTKKVGQSFSLRQSFVRLRTHSSDLLFVGDRQRSPLCSRGPGWRSAYRPVQISVGCQCLGNEPWYRTPDPSHGSTTGNAR